MYYDEMSQNCRSKFKSNHEILYKKKSLKSLICRWTVLNFSIKSSFYLSVNRLKIAFKFLSADELPSVGELSQYFVGENVIKLSLQ